MQTCESMQQYNLLLKLGWVGLSGGFSVQINVPGTCKSIDDAIEH